MIDLKTKEEIIEYIKDGHTKAEASELFGVKQPTISVWLRSMRIKSNDQHRIPDEVKEQMRAYKAEGHTNREVSAMFFVNYETTKQICRWIAPQEGATKPSEETLKRYISIVEEKGWQYIGGYANADKPIKCRCNACNNISLLSGISIRSGCSLECPICKEDKKQKKAKQKKIDRYKRSVDDKLRMEQKRMSNLNKQWERIFDTKWHECPICGKMTSNKVTCSGECSNKYSWRKKELRRRTKIKEVLIDDISLEEVFRRDKGVCYICGSECNWNDYEWRNGIKIAGNDYPSMDHVIPLAKGGKHSWDNIRLAHRICNSKKSDNIPR